jgi:heterogeneous nuclear ribonucleoprotein F/H
MALVEFPSAQEATMGLAKNKAVMGTRYIELFPATRGDLDKFGSRTGEPL